MTKEKCYCGSGDSFQDCCEPLIKGIRKAATAEALMRSRYAAYATHEVDYLMATTHRSQRNSHSKSEILNWATANQWLRLEIIHTTSHTVAFKAYFLDPMLQKQVHQERSAFTFESGSWFYVDGEFFS